MTAGALDVLIASKLAGTLSQDGAGSLSFAYERGYRGVPLSSSVPLSTRPYRDKVVLPYLWGLLPEDPAARGHVADDAGISPNNPFALLGVIGLDCPGAVQFVPRGSDACRDERLVAVSDAEIARRLATGRRDGAGWIADNEHWSLGGRAVAQCRSNPMSDVAAVFGQAMMGALAAILAESNEMAEAFSKNEGAYMGFLNESLLPYVYRRANTDEK